MKTYYSTIALALCMTACGNDLTPSLNPTTTIQQTIQPAAKVATVATVSPVVDTDTSKSAELQPDVIVGPMGPQGVAGDKGDTGSVGMTGPKGDVGAVGPTGPQGPAGVAGSMGATGAQGNAGAQGVVGVAGVNGAAIVMDLDCMNVPTTFPDGSVGTVSGQVIAYASGARWITFYVTDSNGDFYSERSKVLPTGGMDLQLNVPGGPRDLEFVFGSPPSLSMNSQVINDSDLYCNKAI